MKTKDEIMQRLEALHEFQRICMGKRISTSDRKKSYDKINDEILLEEFPYGNKPQDEIAIIVQGEIYALNWAMGTIED